MNLGGCNSAHTGGVLQVITGTSDSGGATVCPPTRSSSPLTWIPALHPQPPADAVFLGVWRPGAHRQEASPVQKLPEAGHGGLAQKTVSDHDSDPWQGGATGFLLAP